MDYTEKCTELMMHLGTNFSQGDMAELIAAFADGIARTIALMHDHDLMHEQLSSLCEAMHKAACEYHAAMHGDGDHDIDAETFLREVFHKDKFDA